MGDSSPNRFLRLLFWESLQNLPATAGLTGGMLLWRRSPAAALAAMATGGLLCALTIAATERRMWPGFREPARVVAANAAAMSAFQVAVVAYLHAPWGRWWSDALIGGGVGGALGIAQDAAAGRRRFDLRHWGALSAAAAVALLLARAIFFGLPPRGGLYVFGALAILNIGVSAFIVLIEYAPHGAET